jgi:hypothetical protein
MVAVSPPRSRADQGSNQALARDGTPRRPRGRGDTRDSDAESGLWRLARRHCFQPTCYFGGTPREERLTRDGGGRHSADCEMLW